MLRLASTRSRVLVEGLKSSIQSEVDPSALVREWLLARISLSTTGKLTEVLATIFVLSCTAFNCMPKTSSELVVLI